MIRDLQILYDAGTSVGLTDGELLDRFQSACRADDQDGAECALTALINRHSGLVWNVCQCIVRDRHEAEDAFQATFLILVRKAGSLRAADTLGPWLQVVAGRIALKLRKARTRRHAVECGGVELVPGASSAIVAGAAGHDADEVLGAIHTEIMKLPSAFRDVIVLCDVEGVSYSETAMRLKIPLGTVQSRLARARRRMREALVQRGIQPADSRETIESPRAPSSGRLLALPLSPALVTRVARLGALVALNPVYLNMTMTGSVRKLVNGGLRTMSLGKALRIVILPLAGVVVGAAILYTDAWSRQAGLPGDAQGGVLKVKPDKDRKQPPEIPRPRDLNVSSGRGKVVLYLLDRDGNRVPERRDGKTIRFQQVERELEWAAITGEIDHIRVLNALFHGQPLPPAEQLYLRAELQRQTQRDDGSWQPWARIDPEPNLKILDNLAATDPERVPERFFLYALIDPLPHLTQGSWSGVDVERFVPAGTPARLKTPIAGVKPLAPQKGRPPALMLRSLDFTVDPGRAYRYQVRIVTFNPAFNQGNPQNRNKWIFGPWSEATEIVTIPAAGRGIGEMKPKPR